MAPRCREFCVTCQICARLVVLLSCSILQGRRREKWPQGRREFLALPPDGQVEAIPAADPSASARPEGQALGHGVEGTRREQVLWQQEL